MRKRTLVLFLLGAVAIAFAASVSADEDPALLQRAIDYETWLRDHHVPGYGGIVQIMFETEDLEKVLYYRGQGDSTMWTATYCAAESFRYAVTGEIEAKDNAVAAVNRDTGRIEVTTTHDREHRRARVEVRDNGTGVSRADKVKMFEPYYSTKKSGSGLGLAIVSSIIGEHRGSVTVSDNEPRGTVVAFELPIEPVEEPALAADVGGRSG